MNENAPKMKSLVEIRQQASTMVADKALREHRVVDPESEEYATEVENVARLLVHSNGIENVDLSGRAEKKSDSMPQSSAQ